MTTKPMKSIGAAKFKEQCAILDQLDDEGVIITRHGKPVARVIPIRAGSSDLIGALRDRVAFRGNIRLESLVIADDDRTGCYGHLRGILVLSENNTLLRRTGHEKAPVSPAVLARESDR